MKLYKQSNDFKHCLSTISHVQYPIFMPVPRQVVIQTKLYHNQTSSGSLIFIILSSTAVKTIATFWFRANSDNSGLPAF